MMRRGVAVLVCAACVPALGRELGKTGEAFTLPKEGLYLS